MSGVNRSKKVLIIRVRAWNKENILPQRIDTVMNLLKKNVSLKFFDIQPERKLGYYLGYLFSFLSAYPKLLFTSCDSIILENPYLVIFAPLFWLRRKKIVAEYVDYYPANLNRLKNERFFRYQVAKIICRIFHNFVTVITTESETGKRTLHHWGVPTKKLQILPVGINTQKMLFSQEKRQQIRKRYQLSDNSLVIGYLGKMVKFYSIENILLAVSKLPSDKKDFKLLFVGDGPYREELEKLSKKLQLNIIFTGNVPHDEVYSYYSAMDIFVFPLNSLAIKIAEILSLGGPLLIVSKGMPEDWIVDGVNGLVSNSHPSAIQKTILKYLELSLSQKHEIISAQQKFARSNLDRTIVARKYLELV